MTLTVSPTSAKRNAAAAMRAAATGSRRAAGLAVYQALLGTDWQLVLLRGGSAVVTLNFTSQITISSNTFVIPAYNSLSGLTTADIDTGTWTAKVQTSDATTLVLSGTATKTGGAGEFLLSDDLTSGGTVTLGTVTLYFDPAIETATFYPLPANGFIESSDGTTVTTTTAQITDSGGLVWKLTGGAQISRTTPAGVTTTDATTANVIEIYYQRNANGRTVWQQNTQLLWWKWNYVTGIWEPQGSTGPTSGTGQIDPPIPGAQIPRPNTAPDGTAISSMFLTTPKVVNTTVLGLHCYDYPVKTSWHQPTTKPTIGYKVLRTHNNNDNAASMHQIFPTELGARAWGHLDAMLDACAADGAKLLWTCMFTPSWLVNGARLGWPSPAPNWLGSTTMPTDLSKLTAIVTEVVNHCNSRQPGVLIAVEVWNEPAVQGTDYYSSGAISSSYWYGSVLGNGGGKEAQRLQDLADVHKAIWTGVQAASTPVPVIGPPWSPENIADADTVAYYSGITCSGGGNPVDYTDAYGVHAYTTGTSFTAGLGSGGIKAVFDMYVGNRDAVDSTLPIYNTESGQEGGITPAQHAVAIKRKAMYAACKGWRTNCHYAWEDTFYLGNPGGGGDGDLIQHAEPHDALQWVTNNVVNTSTTTNNGSNVIIDWAATLSDGRVCLWFRDLTTAVA
jgi:hypothetical protein